MNFIDLIFLLFLVAMLAVGFFQGMIRLGVLLAAFYLSLVLASLYYPALGGFFFRSFGSARYVSEYTAFALVLMLSFIVLTVAGLYTFRYARFPGQLEYVDRIGGVLLGLVFGSLIIGMFAVLLWNMMILRGGETLDFPIMGALGRSVRGSFLLRYFANSILPQVYDIVDPILPDGAKFIFVI